MFLNDRGSTQRSHPGQILPRRRSRFQLIALLAVLWISCPAWADEDEERYLRLVNIIQEGDALSTKGRTEAALTKYKEAQTELQRFRRTYPDWNAKMVGYRQKYLSEKIEACSSKPANSGGPGDTAQSAKAPGEGDSRIRLLEAGAEPRHVLRLHPQAGDKQSLTLKLKTAMDMKIGEMANPTMALPAILMMMEITPKDVSAEGDIRYEMVIADASVAADPGTIPQMVEAMKASFGGLKGLSGTGTLTSRGVNRGTEMKIPAGTDPQLEQAMDQMKQSFATMSTPLPEEPVGPGAKWESKIPIKSQGMSLDQATSYELVSIEGDQLVLKTTITQTASNQKIQSPMMPALKMDLNKLTGTGKGEVTFNLTRLLPRQAAIDSHSELLMGMNAGGQKQSLEMKIDVNMELESK